MKAQEGIYAASQLILDYHVSLGDSVDGHVLASPNGSGTFVKFSVLNKTMFGILTAAHIARRLKITTKDMHQFIGISKPHLQDALGCLTPFYFIFCNADIRHFHSKLDEGYLPDIAFIALGIDTFPKHEIFTKSKFYDLDANTELGYEEDMNIFSTFFRGACNDDEITKEGLLAEFCLGGGETIRFDNETNISYWKIPNSSNKSIAGASGAGFWRHKIDKENLQTSLEGVIIAESLLYDYVEAISPSYLYDTFLPNLKKYSIDFLKEQVSSP
ncbi:MAG: hypothetical protein LLF94_07145 [Chlamydiales bacterium]|nr:hypothetical protein [Chlamydiales bacterium]